MAIDLASSHRTIPADQRSPTDDYVPDWSEQLITTVATALAVVLVAVVAVLMGSA
jgi:hypothetical protein